MSLPRATWATGIAIDDHIIVLDRFLTAILNRRIKILYW